MSTIDEQTVRASFLSHVGKKFEEATVADRSAAALKSIVELSSQTGVSPSLVAYAWYEAQIENVETFLEEDIRRASVKAKACRVAQAIDILKAHPEASCLSRAITILERINHVPSC